MNSELAKKSKQAFIADIIIFTLLAVVGEFISQKGLDYFYTGFYFSISALPLFILLYRWGVRGLPSLIVFGLVSSFILAGATVATFVVNIIGYSGLALGMLLFIKPGRDDIKMSLHFALLYIFLGFLGMIVLRSLILTFFESNFLSSLLLIGSNEALNFLACALIFIIMRKNKAYLIYLPDIYREAYEANKEQGKYL